MKSVDLQRSSPGKLESTDTLDEFCSTTILALFAPPCRAIVLSGGIRCIPLAFKLSYDANYGTLTKICNHSYMENVLIYYQTSGLRFSISAAGLFMPLMVLLSA